MNTSNFYIMNSPIYNNVKNPGAVDGEVTKILEKMSQIAGKDRKITMVIGLNAPQDTSVSDEQMNIASERARNIAKQFQNENLEVRVIHYRWERFDHRLQKRDFKANERINYVAIRNNLFYSKENLEATQKMIEEAKKHNQASVKFFALDGDSEISLERMQFLESHWNKETYVAQEGSSPQGYDSVHLPPVITSGFYQFDFDPENSKLVSPNGALNWGMYLATIENKMDVETKKLLGAKKFNSQLLYRKLSLPVENKDISADYILTRMPKFQKNLFVLDKQSSPTIPEFDLLKIHFCDILSLKDAYKEALTDQSPEGVYAANIIHERLVSTLREIEKIESTIDKIEELNYKFSVAGQQILYPTESVMFVSLFDKIKDREFNLFEKINASAQATDKKTRKLWGNDVGREEGENIVSQMRKFWESTLSEKREFVDTLEPKPANFNQLSKTEQHAWIQKKIRHKAKLLNREERELVSFPHVFKTALPPRTHQFVTDEQNRIAAAMPQMYEELKKIAQDPGQLNKLVDQCAELITTRSQTSLSLKFLNQRLNFIKGQAAQKL